MADVAPTLYPAMRYRDEPVTLTVALVGPLAKISTGVASTTLRRSSF